MRNVYLYKRVIVIVYWSEYPDEIIMRASEVSERENNKVYC